MNNKRYTIFTFLLVGLFLFSGCMKKKNNSATPCDAVSKEKMNFYSLKTYFCQAIIDYEAKDYKVNKRVNFGDQSEFKEAMEVSWKAEFETFIAADINHTAWFDKFKTDTNQLADSYIVTYTCNTASIPVKMVQAQFLNNKTLSKITIKTERKNLLYKSKQLITFEPESHYHVDGFQRTLFLSKSEFSVDGVIVKPSDH